MKILYKQKIKLSIIIPVYNRPYQIDELLNSLLEQDFTDSYQIIIVEDGSTITCKSIVEKYISLDILYLYKQNSGPGDSRNFGMQKADGDYFIILDSDCVLPKDYLSQIKLSLYNNYADCFGGIDDAQTGFSPIQKAINFAMTSVFTTGGIRGSSEKITKFQPRSFNMGISKKAFNSSGGFSNLHPGEDPDLAMRLWNLGFETRLFKNVKVYHKRRISWRSFFVQVNKFGKARVILNKWHPKYTKLIFFLPILFLIGFVFSVLLLLLDFPFLFCFYVLYFAVCGIISSIKNKSIKVGWLSICAISIQFYGYGTGFLKAFYRINILNKKPEKAFPKMFF